VKTEYGYSSYSDINANSVVAQSAPVALVTNFAVAPHKDSFVLTWDPITTDANTGYSAITKFVVSWDLGSAGSLSQTYDLTTGLSSPTLTITNAAPTNYAVTALTAYKFNVVPHNVHGAGQPLAADVTSTSLDVPAVIAAPVITQQSGTDKITITWATPTDNGSPITDYQVLWKKSDNSYVESNSLCDGTSKVGNTLSCTDVSITSIKTLTGRALNDDILAGVISVNAEGSSPQSPDSSTTVKIQSAPTAFPGSLAATTNSDVAVTVTWTDLNDASTDAGYNAITKYVVYYRTGSAAWSSVDTTDGNVVSQ